MKTTPRVLACSTALICLLLLPGLCTAAGKETASQAQDKAVWSVAAKFSRLIDSHTSYEFGDPFQKELNPLSKLEFALDSWWGGIVAKRWTPRWSIGLEAMTNLLNDVVGVMADSDWEEPSQPKTRTTYSESQLRLEHSYMVKASADFSVARWLSLPAGLDLRPVGGIRWQFFDLMAHDGTQWESNPDGSVSAVHLPGDSIRFKQTFWHFFLGLRLCWQPRPISNPGLKFSLQADWASVVGQNTDHHLLRSGYRVTEETTSGEAWHFSLDLEAPLTRRLAIGAQAEYLTLDTQGHHRLYNTLGDEVLFDETWTHGVRVWSRQASFSIMLKYSF